MNNHRASSKQLKRELQDASGCSVSTRTVRKSILHAGLKGCIAAKKPMLTSKHRSACFSWAKERRIWQHSQWAKILWSDESVFEIVPGRRVRVRRRGELGKNSIKTIWYPLSSLEGENSGLGVYVS